MTKTISKLHYITQDLDGKSHSELAELACKAGVDWVQLRMKNVDDEQWFDEAIKTFIVCKKYGAQLIINDNPELAVELGADGVHLGKEDMPLDEAREIIGPDMILGATANSFEDIKRIAKYEVDYIGLGPFRFTSTKQKLSPVLGINEFADILAQMKRDEISIPVIAIGGIQPTDVLAIIKTGVYGIAVASEINRAEDREKVIAMFYKGIR